MLKRSILRVFNLVRPVMPRKVNSHLALWSQQYFFIPEPELKHLARVLSVLKLEPGLAVDVGANRGVWSVSLATHFRDVLLVEPNPTLVTSLRDVARPNWEIVHTGLSDAAGRLDLYLPSVNDLELEGWASFDPDNCPDANSVRSVSVPVTTLDTLVACRTPAFIKIDVEGHELEVLRGAEYTLSVCKPVFMIEVRSANRVAVSAYMQRFGYEASSLLDICGIDGGSENTFFTFTSRQ